MMTRTIPPWIAMSCLALTLGCNAFPSVAEVDGTFADSLRTYAKLVRWGEIDRASLFVVNEQRAEFLALSRDLERFRFTDFDVAPVRFDEDGAWARVKVVYHVYDIATLVEKRIVDEQVWTKDGHASWLVRTDISGFQSALGLPPSAPNRPSAPRAQSPASYDDPNG